MPTIFSIALVFDPAAWAVCLNMGEGGSGTVRCEQWTLSLGFLQFTLQWITRR